MSTVNLINYAHKENGDKPFCIEEKFANLPPSKDILDFYRKQIKSIEEDNISTNLKLEQYKLLCDDYHNALMKISNYETEVHNLQKALSDLQECLFQEKDLNDRLKAELHTSKFRQTNNSKKVGQLKQKVVCHRSWRQKENEEFDTSDNFIIDVYGNKSDQYLKQGGDENLNYEVESLRKQLDDQSSSFEEKLRRVLEEEGKKCKQAEKQRKEDKEMIDMLTHKLRRAQDMLHDITKELVDLRKTQNEEALGWAEEKEELMKEVKFSRKEAANIARKTLTVVEQKLRDAEKRNDLLKARLQQSNAELTIRKEEYEAKYNELEGRLEQTTSCLSILNKRYKDLEVRRKLEIEGHKTDAIHLRNKLENVETQYYKIALSYSKDLGLCNDDDGNDDYDCNRKEFDVKIPRKVVSSGSSLKSEKSLKMKSRRSKSRKH